ncbi:acyl-CoA dehydrogenase family protein [Parasphingorhabdus pacifica]
MTSSDLLYNEVEDDLRDNVRRLAQQRCDWTDVLARCESDEPYDLALWRTLADEMGLASLLVPESAGGAGASARELAVVAEELGRAVAPVPFLGNVLTTAALVECSRQPKAAEVLPRLAGGAHVATLAVGLTTPPFAEFPTAVRADGGSLSGTVNAVVDLEVADSALVPVSGPDGPALHWLDLTAAGVSVQPLTPLDLTRRIGRLTLDGAVGEEIARGDDAERILRRALLTGAGILASEQAGLAQHCLDATVEYVQTRYQFGRRIGSFQAVKHRLADLWTGVSTARAAARNAADALARADAEGELAVAVAQAYCSDVVVLAAEESLQLHGGIGMTWEHPTHLYLGRAKSSQLTFGIAERHRAHIATLVDIEAPTAS